MRPRQIRVLMIVSSLAFGGAERHVVNLINSLDPTRFRLSLAYLKDSSALLPEIRPGRLPGGVFCLGLARKLDSGAVKRLADHIRDEEIDVVMCTNTYPLLYAWLASLAPGRRRDATRPRIIEVFHSTHLGSLREKLEMVFYAPWMLAADRVVYVCHNQRRFWRRRGLRAPSDTVIHNGIDVSHFSNRYSAEQIREVRARHDIAENDYVIGLCAVMRPEKAHGDLVEAVSRLTRQGIPVKALLIGDGPQREAIETLIDRRGLRSRIHITGFVQDVRPLIAACDVMTITSHHVETFSLAALEAMALGKPLIMTDIGGASEQIVPGHNGHLYRPGDIDALVKALQALDDTDTRQVMGTRALARVTADFSLDRMVEAYESLFGQITDQAFRQEAPHGT